MKTSCYMCGAETTDYYRDCYSCCYACCHKIYMRAGRAEYLDEINVDGLGFEKNSPMNWEKYINEVIDAVLAANSATRKKVYTNQCPCGLEPSQCDYHR